MIEWIQGPFTVEPLRYDIQQSDAHVPPKIGLQAENRRYSLNGPPNPNQIAQRRRPNGFSVFLQRRALKPF